jgi:flagellar biosynthesis/type III secretory pathway protein FliH
MPPYANSPLVRAFVAGAEWRAAAALAEAPRFDGADEAGHQRLIEAAARIDPLRGEYERGRHHGYHKGRDEAMAEAQERIWAWAHETGELRQESIARLRDLLATVEEAKP